MGDPQWVYTQHDSEESASAVVKCTAGTTVQQPLLPLLDSHHQQFSVSHLLEMGGPKTSSLSPSIQLPLSKETQTIWEGSAAMLKTVERPGCAQKGF